MWADTFGGGKVHREEIENCIDDTDVTMTQVMNKGKGFIIEV